jgi:hypothetical protein
MRGLANVKFLNIFSKNTHILHNIKIRSLGAEMFHTDRRRDVTNQTVAFRNFANAPKNHDGLDR